MVSPDQGGYRFVVLVFSNMMTFGLYFCFDMPSVLQEQFQKNTSCPLVNISTENTMTDVAPTDCCSDCLGMSPDQYNLLYAMFAWTNAIVVIGAGFFFDKLGNMVGLLLFSSLGLVGACFVALGAMFSGTSAMLPLMLCGRLMFGAGQGAVTVGQFRLVSFWFRNKELSMAFGTQIAVSRLGSVLNFLLTENFAEHFGIVWALWGGAILCATGFISAVVASLLDRQGLKKLGVEADIKIQSKLLKPSDIRKFGPAYWMASLCLVTYYSGVFPFVADSSKFIEDKYGYKDSAPYIAGAIYDISLILSPVLGYLVDIIGKRGWILLVSSLLNIPIFVLLTFTYVHPLICTVSLGLTYSFMAVSLWSSVPLVVPAVTVGTATGITSSLQMVGVGIANVVVGQILGDKESLSVSVTLHRWKYVMAYLLGNQGLCVVCAAALIVIDQRRGSILNRSKRDRLMAQARAESMVTEDRDHGDTDTEPLIHDIYPESDFDQRSDVPGLSTDASSNTTEPRYSINK